MSPTDPLLTTEDGQTPLDPDTLAGLRPTWIATQGDLNKAENDNIQDALIWSQRQRWTTNRILSPNMLAKLHRNMFGQVWTWAGKSRTSGTNIGCDYWNIPTELINLCADTQTQLKHPNEQTIDDIAIRFHHRLILIHPFPNGNGRHAREATSLLLIASNKPRFTWGTTNSTTARTRYLAALRTADRTLDFQPLLDLARS